MPEDCVSAEEGEVRAGVPGCGEGLAHRGRVVLVVAVSDDRGGVGEQRRIGFQLQVGLVGDRQTVLLGEGDQALVEGEEESVARLLVGVEVGPVE